MIRNLGQLICCSTLLLCGTWTLSADQIIGSSTGLATPTSVVTLDELGNMGNGTLITTQFEPFGIQLWLGWQWDDGSHGQAGSTGFSGGDVVNSDNLGNRMEIQFTQELTGAAFAAVDQNGTFMVTAMHGGDQGTVVDSFTTQIGFNPGAGYLGFDNLSNFETIIITPIGNSAHLAIDNIQFHVPEPGLAFFFLPAIGLGLFGLRKRFA